MSSTAHILHTRLPLDVRPAAGAFGDSTHVATVTIDVLGRLVTVTSTAIVAPNLLPAPTADFSINSHKLTSVSDPTNPQDAATKNYVDLAVAAIAEHQEVLASSTIALTELSYTNNGGVGDILTLAVGTVLLDGQVLVVNGRYLIKNQANAAHNGIWVCNTVGTVIISAVFTRATDFDQESDGIAGALVFVQNGTVNDDTRWVCSASGVIVWGTTNINWSQYLGGVYAADGTSLILTGTTFSIKSTWAGQTSIITLGTVTTGTWQATAVGSQWGGTGLDTHSSTGMPIITAGTWSVAKGNPYPFFFKPPVYSDWTFITQAGHSFTDQTGDSTVNGIYLKAPTNSSAHKVSLGYKTAPTADGTHPIDFALSTVIQNAVGQAIVGIGFRNSSNGKLVMLAFTCTSFDWHVYLLRYTNDTTFSALPVDSTIGQLDFQSGMLRLRAKSDGTTLTFTAGADGKNYDDPMTTETIATFIGTADQIFWGSDPFSDFSAVTLVHYKEN